MAAVHEAGHVVMARYVGIPSPWASPQRTAGGSTIENKIKY